MIFEPVTVITGTETYEPVRASIAEGVLVVTDRAGTVLASVQVLGEIEGRPKVRTIETVEGTWGINDICGCSSRKKALLRQWRTGEVPA